MSYFDYMESKRIAAQGFPFYALIMAAMRQADTDNVAKLQAAFPRVWSELSARYNAPGGLLPDEREALESRHEEEGPDVTAGFNAAQFDADNANEG